MYAEIITYRGKNDDEYELVKSELAFLGDEYKNFGDNPIHKRDPTEEDCKQQGLVRVQRKKPKYGSLKPSHRCQQPRKKRE